MRYLLQVRDMQRGRRKWIQVGVDARQGESGDMQGRERVKTGKGRSEGKAGRGGDRAEGSATRERMEWRQVMKGVSEDRKGSGGDKEEGSGNKGESGVEARHEGSK